MVSGVIVVLVCALIAHQIWTDRTQYPKFEAATASEERQKWLRKWLIDSFIRYGVIGLVCLYVLEPGWSVLRLPPDMALSRDLLFGGGPFSVDNLSGWAFGFAIFLILLMAALSVIPFLTKPPELPEGGTMAMLPRNWREAGYTSGLSVNAGVSEEIVFRLVLVIAILDLTGSLLIAITVASALFAIAHAYQGVGGVIASGIAGLVLMGIYLLTGQLWLIVIIHILSDLRALLFLPWGMGWFRTRPGASH